MRPESKQFSGRTLRELPEEQQREFVENVTQQSWLSEWLLTVLSAPLAEHFIEGNIDGWQNLIASFDDRNKTHQGKAYHTPDQDTLENWTITLDRNNRRVVVTFKPSDHNPSIKPSTLAALSNRIQFYQNYPVLVAD